MNKSFKYVKPPELCEECGDSLKVAVAAVDDGITKLLHHCPHNQTLVFLHLENQDGERVITRWLLESPATEQYAVDLAKKFGKEYGAELEVFHNAKLH